jgi:RNA polymerase primary sigma factor/RNA polymerase sigma factor
MGVTKERIRQLEARALSKLREAADVEKIEVP